MNTISSKFGLKLLTFYIFFWLKILQKKNHDQYKITHTDALSLFPNSIVKFILSCFYENKYSDYMSLYIYKNYANLIHKVI